MAHLSKQHTKYRHFPWGKTMRRVLLALVLLISAGYLYPEHFVRPVAGMDAGSFHHKSFWYYPWGASVRHKGVDIFAPSGTPVRASTIGIVLYCGRHKRGGNMVLVLGPRWRVHHYLHLDTIAASPYHFVRRGTVLGTVGNTGNAVGKPSHLHYAITTPIPYLWQADTGIQGWKKIWYIDPTPRLLRAKT